MENLHRGPVGLRVRIGAFPIHPGAMLTISTMQTLSAASETTGLATEVSDGVGGFRANTRVTFFAHHGP